MKTKYKGICSIAMMVTAALAILGYGYSGWWRQVMPPVAVMPVESPQKIWTPNPQQLESIRQLSHRLSILAYPSDKKIPSSSLALFGQLPRSLDNAGVQARGEAKHGYNLSLTMVAGPMRYCIINGSFLAEGARMEDGALVAKIEDERVLLATSDERQWVLLDKEQGVSGQTGPRQNGPKGSRS